MNTPTPRTDEARRIDNGDTHPLLDEMETLERELATEREKVRVLQEAMKFSANKDKYFQAQFDPCQRASAALAATEGTK